MFKIVRKLYLISQLKLKFSQNFLIRNTLIFRKLQTEKAMSYTLLRNHSTYNVKNFVIVFSNLKTCEPAEFYDHFSLPFQLEQILKICEILLNGFLNVDI